MKHKVASGPRSCFVLCRWSVSKGRAARFVITLTILSFTYSLGVLPALISPELAHAARAQKVLLAQMGGKSSGHGYATLSSGVESGSLETYAAQLLTVGQPAEIAVRILGGELPPSLSLPASFSNLYFSDWRQVQRWKIPAARLPGGSFIFVSNRSLWDHYGWTFLAGALLTFLEALLIAGLLVSRRRRRIAEETTRTSEIETRELRQELAHTGRVLVMGELSGALAHELNQPLASILSNAQAALHLLDEESIDFVELKDALPKKAPESN